MTTTVTTAIAAEAHATLNVQDLKYDAVLEGEDGEGITIEYLAAVKASRNIQDIAYTSKWAGVEGNATNVAYVAALKSTLTVQNLKYDAAAVGVLGNDISVETIAATKANLTKKNLTWEHPIVGTVGNGKSIEMIAATKAVLTVQKIGYTAKAVGTAGNSITMTYEAAVVATKDIQDITYTSAFVGTLGNSTSVSYVDAVFAGKTIQDLQFTAATAGVAGNSPSVAYVAAVKASRVIQDITFTHKAVGSLGNAITIDYIAGGTAGSEVVAEVGGAVTIEIEAGVSTATQVKAAWDAQEIITPLPCLAVITGTGATPQESIGAAVNLQNGTGTAAGADVSLATTPAIVVTIESGVTDANAVKTAWDLVAGALALATVAVIGGGGATPQVAAVAAALEGGTGAAVGNVDLSATPAVVMTIISATTTATQVKAFWDAVGGALALATCAVIGGGGATPQVAVGATPLLGGTGLAAGAVISAVATSITATIESGVTLASVIKTAIDASGLSNSLVSCALNAADGAQIAAVLAPLATGTGIAADAVISVAAPVVTITIEDGVTTATAIKTAWDLVGGATAIATCTIIGGGGAVAQDAFVLIALATGTGTAAAALVTVAVKAIAIVIESGVTTADTIKAAYDLVGAATALAACSVVGGGGAVAQTASAHAHLAAGTGLAAGAVVSVASPAISVTIETGVTTATTLKTAWDLSAAALALATCAVIGGGGATPQVAAVAVVLQNGTGLLGSAVVSVITKAISALIDDGNVTATALRAKILAFPAAAALVGCSVIGAGGSTMQVAAVATPLASGTGWQEVLDLDHYAYLAESMEVTGTGEVDFKIANSLPLDTAVPDFSLGAEASKVGLNGAIVALYARSDLGGSATAVITWKRQTSFSHEVVSASFAECADFGDHNNPFRSLQIQNPEALAVSFSWDGVNTSFSLAAGITSVTFSNYDLRGKLYVKAAATPLIQINVWS